MVMFICGSGDFLVSTHLVPWATDAGISATTAGNMLAWFGLMSLGGLLVAGPVADRFGMKIPMAITFLIRTALFLMVLKYEGPLFFYIFAMAFGFTFAVTAPYAPMMVGKLYGLSHVGILSGFIATIHHSAGGFWTYMGGVFFDRTGNYEFAFLASAIMAFVASLSSLFIREKRHYPKFQR
jgi:predicted MFS family arabinose efflux permease